MSIEWIFDPAPPSGARRGGNAAEYGFEGHIDTLVRETVQNSMDAGKAWEIKVDVTFRLVELTGDDMASFLEGMQWGSLQDNLLAVPENRGGDSIHRAVKELNEKERLLLLCIEDRGTDGLTGLEQRQTDSEVNRFSALVRDELYSDKDDPSAGGSHGLGKILLWAYSAFKTVLFSSVPRNCPSGHAGLRFVGRTSLPYHQTTDDDRCAGPGWLGIPRGGQEGNAHERYAESVWGQEGKQHARNCNAERNEDDYGLTTVIVGFEEPGQETREAGEIVESIEKAVLESFWPAITLNHLAVTVIYERDGERLSELDVRPSDNPVYCELATLLDGYKNNRMEAKERLENQGESTYREVKIEIPKKISDPEHGDINGRCVLLVKLIGDENRLEPVKDSIHRFRRPGMVVRKSGGQSLSISARPYIAALLCGRACGDDVTDGYTETFLRTSEPPEHDKWLPDTRGIKANYKTYGIKAKLDRFELAILAAVRDLVSLPEKKGGGLPKELLKHLRFGESSGGGHPRFLTSTTSARVSDDVWKFNIRCVRSMPDEFPWHIIVKLKYAVDGGSADDVHAIESVTSEKATKIEVRKGDAYIEYPPNVKIVNIEGQTGKDSLPAIGTRAAIQLYVDGQQGGLDNA